MLSAIRCLGHRYWYYDGSPIADHVVLKSEVPVFDLTPWELHVLFPREFPLGSLDDLTKWQ